MNRILIVRLGSLGDLVHTLPAASAIRRAHPDAEIDWLVDAAHQEFLALVPVISSVVVLRDRTIGAWREARRQLRTRRYDVALDFQGLLKSAALARLSGAGRVLGFDRRSLREPVASMFYTGTEQVGDADVGDVPHVIEKNLRLAAAIGATSGKYEFPIDVRESAAIAAWRAAHEGDYAVLNPGAAWPNKRWPVESFASVARWLREHRGWTSMVLWGPGESELAESVVAASDSSAAAAPATRIADLMPAFRDARLVVSGDTGPLHIAAALGAPVVALYGPTNPRRNGPWNTGDVSISRYEQCDCHYQRQCRRAAVDWCLGHISVDDVVSRIKT